MNEFIAWNNGTNGFRPMVDGAFISGGKINPCYNHEIFAYIGKTDIEGNKIYAESSIVQVKITYDYGETFDILKGWFRWNSEGLNYELIVPVNHNNNLNPREKYNYSKLHYKMCGLKIIDTLQENKLGLFNENT